MHTESIRNFMSYAVSEVHPTLFATWDAGDMPGIDINAILTYVALEMFISGESGSVADYVRGLIEARRDGRLVWEN